MRILVTGCAGFIGSHTCEKLLKDGNRVMGIDNLNHYYDVNIKLKNLEILKKYDHFYFIEDDIRTTTVINDWTPDVVCHLASMAGVRYSIDHPRLYIDVNINGFINLLEQSRKKGVKQIVYASSSSVYGLNKKVPFSEEDPIETPNSPYACSKMSMELLAKTYNQLYNLNLIGLRFFTVYGPRGRPDMAPYKFLKAINDGTTFQKYGDGTSSRDYTYIDDIVNGVVSSIKNEKGVKCEIYNLGNSTPVSLNEFIGLCEKVVGKKAKYNQIENQLGDVPHTYADISKANKDLDYEPKVGLEEGLIKTYNYLKQIQ
jgi:UDP-glucuronate 4-epimerase